MKFWNVTALASDLGKDQVPEKDQLKYLIFFVAVSTLGADPYIASLVNYPKAGFYDEVTLGISLLIAISGTAFCYSAVRSTDKSTGFVS